MLICAARVQAQTRNIYVLSIIDDCCRKVWIYLLKTKDEAFVRFKG